MESNKNKNGTDNIKLKIKVTSEKKDIKNTRKKTIKQLKQIRIAQTLKLKKNLQQTKKKQL